MSTYAEELAAATKRQEAKKERELYPRLLLNDLPPTAEREQLVEAATEKWPGMDEARRQRIIQNAVALREQSRAGQRHLDPNEIAIRHPSQRERIDMVRTEAVRTFIAGLIEDTPDIDYGEINRHVNQRFDADLSRQETSALARFVRKDLKKNGATNGNEKPTPADPSAAEAGPEPPPATDSTEGEAPAGDPARDRLRDYARAYIAFSLVNDRDLDDPVRKQVRGNLYDLEEQLIGDLTANANHAEVERRALELYDTADALRQQAEDLTSALAQAAA